LLDFWGELAVCVSVDVDVIVGIIVVVSVDVIAGAVILIEV